MKFDAVADAVDRALEFTVVGSFSRVGPALRRHLFHWRPPAGESVSERVAVVTGATSGLGLECATELARLGAQVILLVRNAELGSKTAARITTSTGNPNVSVVVGDMGDLASVRLAAKELARLPEVNILIHNAGSLSKDYELSAQGLERTAAVQLVGPYLLTELLHDQLRAGHARVVWVASGGMYAEPLDLDWLEDPAPDYDGVHAYAKVKRAQASLNAWWAPRLAALGITMTAMHPGWVDTPGVRQSLPTFRRLMGPLLRTPALGVDTIIWLVSSPAELTPPGTFWLDRRVRALHRVARTRRSDTDGQRERLAYYCQERSALDLLTEQAP